MNHLKLCIAVGLILAVSVPAGATSLVFSANDIFNYATSDDTRLNQQGTARAIYGARDNGFVALSGARYYETYNDGVNPYDRMAGATATEDLQSVANILSFGADYGHQGVCSIQLWLLGNIAGSWGEKVVLRSGSMTPSANGEFGWTAGLGGSVPVYNTVLGSSAAEQNAISPIFNPAEELFSVTGDFFVDENGNGVYDAGDSELVLGQDYTIWFQATLNNWHYVDAYGNDVWGPGYVEGTLRATAVPEPLTMVGVFLGVAGLGGYIRRRRVA